MIPCKLYYVLRENSLLMGYGDILRGKGRREIFNLLFYWGGRKILDASRREGGRKISYLTYFMDH